MSYVTYGFLFEALWFSSSLDEACLPSLFSPPLGCCFPLCLFLSGKQKDKSYSRPLNSLCNNVPPTLDNSGDDSARGTNICLKKTDNNNIWLNYIWFFIPKHVCSLYTGLDYWYGCMLLWFLNKKTEFGVYFSDFWKWDDTIRGGVPAGCPNLLLKIVHVFDEPSLLFLQVELIALAHLGSALTYWQLLQRLLKLLLCLSQTRLQSEGVQRGHGLGSGEGTR